MTWPKTLKDYRKYTKMIRVDGIVVDKIPLTPPHYKWFGVDSNSKGIYRRYNQDERMTEPKHKFVSISYDTLHKYEVIQ